MTSNPVPGMQLLIDFWGASNLENTAHIESALQQAALACGTTVLVTHLHSFVKNAGVTGIAILANSHISLQTFPEIACMALDISLCGTGDPHRAVSVLHEFFKPRQMKVTESARFKVMPPVGF